MKSWFSSCQLPATSRMGEGPKEYPSALTSQTDFASIKSMGIRNINVIVSGVAQAGSSTVAKLIADSLKTSLPNSRVYNADQDEAPQLQAQRLAAINKELNIIIDTQTKIGGAPNYPELVKTFLNRVNTNLIADVAQLYALAQGVGLTGLTTVDATLARLQEWLTKPAKVESLDARMREAGEIKGKPWRGRRGHI